MKRLAHFISISLWRTKQSGLEVAFKQLRPDTSLYPFEMSTFKFNDTVFFHFIISLSTSSHRFRRVFASSREL